MKRKIGITLGALALVVVLYFVLKTKGDASENLMEYR